MNSIQVILSSVALYEWEIHQMDVKSVFLHRSLSEEKYMDKSPSFLTNSTLVCWLKKSLYGLKQPPQAWYEKIDKFFVNLGFKHCDIIIAFMYFMLRVIH